VQTSIFQLAVNDVTQNNIRDARRAHADGTDDERRVDSVSGIDRQVLSE
jgi:hypothetical protein